MIVNISSEISTVSLLTLDIFEAFAAPGAFGALDGCVAPGFFQKQVFLYKEPERPYLLGAVARVQPGVQRLVMFLRQMAAGQERLPRAEKADRAGIKLLKIP